MFLSLIIVLGLQIFSGNSGVLSFGHIAFMAIGAYTSALLTIPPEIKKFTYLVDAELAQVVDLPGGAQRARGDPRRCGLRDAVRPDHGGADRPAGRRRRRASGRSRSSSSSTSSDVQTTSITRGTSTQIGVPQTTTFLSVMIWVLIFIVVAFVFKQSRLGLRLRASRENERAARSVGVRVSVERAIAWVLSGFVVGVGGALYGHYFVTFGPDDFYFNITFLHRSRCSSSVA